jgi:hypothetical protein
MLKGINQWCFPDGTSLEQIFDTARHLDVIIDGEPR